jgi:large subunit ribosomal protein L22
MDQAIAQLRYLRVAPRKVRLVAGLIRRMPVSEAEAQLMLSPQKSAEHILKLLRSAIANARQGKMDIKKLYVKEIRVNEGPKLKRWAPRARGSMNEIQKKMSHVTLVLGELEVAKGRDFLVPPRTKKERAVEKKKAEKTAKKQKKEIVKEEKEMKPVKEKAAEKKRVFRRKSV